MNPLPRRLVLGAAAGLLAARPGLAVPLPDEWQEFRRRFVLPDGRVVDTGNGGIAHSEGQGSGLLFAYRGGDREMFERILAWTTASLRRGEDSLHAWRWKPDTAFPVDDPNNASDGDLLIAWALALAGRAWGNRDHTRRAQAIARDLLRRCVVRVGPRTLLLPGAEGFTNRSRVVVNLSYYVLPALRAMAQLVPDPTWAQLEADSLALLREVRFGRWGLPPDWVELPRSDGRPQPAMGWPARFSFDAVRIPLNLVWGNRAAEPPVAAAINFWADAGHRVMPAWVDLRAGTLAPYPASSGVAAILQLSMAAQMGRGRRAGLPRVAEAHDYYAAVLTMMTHLAWDDLALASQPA